METTHLSVSVSCVITDLTRMSYRGSEPSTSCWRTWAEARVAALALGLLALTPGSCRAGLGPSVALPDAAAAGRCARRPGAPRAPLTQVCEGGDPHETHHDEDPP